MIWYYTIYLIVTETLMNTVFMSYFEHLAKLSEVANKQTMFLAHLLYRMEFDGNLKQFIVSLSPHDKRKILKDIGCNSKAPLKLASQYIHILVKSELIKYVGGSAYLVCPKSYGSYKYIDKRLRDKNSMVYETRVFSEKNDGVTEFYIITEDGERVDLT